MRREGHGVPLLRAVFGRRAARVAALRPRDPWLGPGLTVRSRQAHSQADATDVTLVILVESSDHGCRFCRAKSEELCTQSGSAGSGCARLFWKASCCSCRRMRFACCLSASRSSAVCRLHRGQAVTDASGALPGDSLNEQALLPFAAPNFHLGPLNAFPYLEGPDSTKTGSPKSRLGGILGELWGNPLGPSSWGSPAPGRAHTLTSLEGAARARMAFRLSPDPRKTRSLPKPEGPHPPHQSRAEARASGYELP